MWHASRMKMVNFQPGWDSLNWCQDVKSKMSFSSEIPKYLRKENMWRFYLYWGLLICKSRGNLIFQVLPDYIWFLWTFALKAKCNFIISWCIPLIALMLYTVSTIIPVVLEISRMFSANHNWILYTSNTDSQETSFQYASVDYWCGS